MATKRMRENRKRKARQEGDIVVGWNVRVEFDRIYDSVRCAYPLMLDVSRRLVVIVGGGAVAARKAKGLLEAGASRIRMISPEFCDAVPAAVERVIERYAPGHLEGAGLVFAATDQADVNSSVVRDAHQLGLLVCRADSSEEDSGDFATPALFREEALVITVSTGGSPTLAAAVRDELAARLDPRWIKMARAMRELRPRATMIVCVNKRRELLRDMASAEAMDVLDKRGIDGLWGWLWERHLKDKD
jgi:precorrin-2 dehydrogenase/sirohydrochlorin ferrochelatase